MIKYTAIIIALLFAFIQLHATHNRAGEITYKHKSGLTFEFTITTITNTKVTSDGFPPADRDSLPIYWGDNTYTILPRIQIIKLSDYYQKNIYIGQHTFPGPGTYEVLVEDPNRNEGVINIPNSIAVVFSIKTIMQINPVLGVNNAPILLNPPVDKAAVNRVFVHNPAAFDPDGDSLSYDLTVCTGENGQPINSYILPESQNRPIFISNDGNLTWDTPVNTGAYNLAFHISEWRNGVKIGQITRDMQVEVFETDNTPPIIDSINQICIIAGQTVNLVTTATDNNNETITLSASGGIFEIDTTAIFTSTPATGKVTGVFKWETKCQHVRNQPYMLLLIASDNNPQIKLVDQQTAYIKVIGPAPANLKATASTNSIELNWDNYLCNNIKGFAIYRSNNTFGYVPQQCETGVPIYTGYEKIAEINGDTVTRFIDNNNGLGLNQGYNYCYMVTAIFNDSESVASNEACTKLVQGVPVITNVSVTKHNNKNGQIFVAWKKPLELDTIKHKGPFVYIVKRATGIWDNNYQIIDTLNFNDTVYNNININTVDTCYNYSIEIHNSKGLTEIPMSASTIWPQILGSNNQIKISFLQNVPWKNYMYTVYKQNITNIDSLGFTNQNYFVDSNVINNNLYCYMVKSYGKYDLNIAPNPLINISHQNCGTPIDTIPPLPPILNVTANCTTFEHKLTWQNNNPYGDVAKYVIYYKYNLTHKMEILYTVLNSDTLQYNYISGSPSACYYITAIDSSGNQSQPSAMVCTDECPYYELPNVFTPNNDNNNDYFIPVTPANIIDMYIDRIDIKIYNRWGGLVYQTTNPHINWDGKSIESNKLLSTGVYYYVCDVYERRITGIEPRYITGFVHIFCGKVINNE